MHHPARVPNKSFSAEGGHSRPRCNQSWYQTQHIQCLLLPNLSSQPQLAAAHSNTINHHTLVGRTLPGMGALTGLPPVAMRMYLVVSVLVPPAERSTLTVCSSTTLARPSAHGARHPAHRATLYGREGGPVVASLSCITGVHKATNTYMQVTRTRLV